MESAAGPSLVSLLFSVAISIIFVVSFWKLFTKAGHAGWKSLIPIYNLYILLVIAGKPGWWIITFFIPFVNIIFLVLVSIALASSFGKGGGFGIGLAFLGFIFYPILAFGDAQYQGAGSP